MPLFLCLPLPPLSLSASLIMGVLFGACCLLGVEGFMHLVVLYGYQGADSDGEQLALTDQLFDAGLGELGVVARGQPCMLVGDFSVEFTKIPCLAKGISAGLWIDLEVSWALASGKQPASTCSMSGVLVVAIIVISWLVALLLLLLCYLARFKLTGGLPLILLLGTLFDYDRWSCRVSQLVRYSPLWPASWLPAVDESRESTSVEVQRVWEIYDDRLHLMSRQDALLLDESLDAGDFSQAWLVWSGAAETALADACRFSGCAAPDRGLVLGRGKAIFRLVRLGVHKFC